MSSNVIIDGNNFMQIAIFAAKRSTKEQDVENKTVQILSAMIRTLQQRFSVWASYYAVWDTHGGTAWRKEANSAYKQGRVQHDNLLQLTVASKGVFRNHMIEQFEIPQSEADDIIYVLAKQLSATKGTTTIVSRDKDLIQIVQDGYADAVFDPVSKKPLVIPSYSIVDYKALVGDSSDGLKGVAGIGDKRARKMLAEGFDRSIIAETRKLVHIPSHPQFAEFERLVQQQLLQITN